VPLLVEIKDQDGAMGPGVGALEAAVAADLVRYPGPVAVMSFNPHSVAALAAAAPLVPRGLTTSAFDPGAWAPLPPEVCARLRAIPDFDAAGAAFLSHEWRDLGRDRVRALAAQGAPVLCWTVRSAAEEAAARHLGAANVTFEGYAPRTPDAAPGGP
jgi:glycerophosphoryl diester phosphodiesterase